ncbi:MAG: hypothetical protein FJ218_10290 [Ignavibacteria bacterium]|nr:hypothetical protein [Ignavibacteria bacterium]
MREFIKSYSSAGRGFGTPSVMQHIGIPKFEEKNKVHQKLSELSLMLHQLKAKGEEEKMTMLEKELDETVMKLFSGK